MYKESVSTEDDFSWEDDEDDESSAPRKEVQSSRLTLEPDPATKSQQKTAISTHMSPRQSSEESYDVVSGNVSVSEGSEVTKQAKEGDADDGDSDWE
jgi:hypothetical protein